LARKDANDSIGCRERKHSILHRNTKRSLQFHLHLCKMERFIKVPEKLLLEAMKICQEMSREIPANVQGLFGELQVALHKLQENSKRVEDVVTCERTCL